MTTTSNKNTQLVVIGAGPGGYTAAFHAADLGLDVTLIDPEAAPGGVCLYRGCIPSKSLLHTVKILAESREAEAFGIHFTAPEIRLEKLRQWKNSVVAKLTNGLGQLLKQRKIKWIQGKAVFVDSRTLRVQENNGAQQNLTFEYAIVAAGSRPAQIPGLPSSPRILNSTTALDLDNIPQSILVVGGGTIGLELGTVYAGLGSKVSVVEMTSGLLPGADRDLVSVLEKRLNKSFTSIMLNTKVTGMEETPTGIQITFKDKDGGTTRQEFEKVLIAVGRKPNSEGLGLEKTRIETDARGFIKIDSQRRTADPAIFAVGDIAGEPMLAHKASHEGRTAAAVIAGKKTSFEPKAIPAVVFTDPEIAWCGLTETQARQETRKITVAKFPWAASGRALTLNRTEGLTKLLIESETQRILGMGIVGSGAGELIAEGVLAVEMGAAAEDLKLAIHPHPTASETIMESAEIFFGSCTHIYRPPKK